ncbi:MAG: dienelactone hydrolase family protein [Caldilineaceae bacterium]|nr:dienelactone hydrolase family protein [Caldilineaceae bacterium]
MATLPEGYWALPVSGQGPAVLVLHPWWGLNETIRAFCRRLADAGFVAFAPDLYHGQVTDTIAEAERLGSALDQNFEQARTEVATAARFLNALSGQNDGGVAVIGFSLGAFYAIDLSTTSPTLVRSVVLFYGTGPGDYEKSQAAYLGHYAENDPYEPQENIDYLTNGLREAGRSITVHTYPDTGHWFFESDRADAYNAEAAALAWERTVAFLREQ